VTEHADDIVAIEALIKRQFSSLSWTEASSGDWAAFASDFTPHALLYPAARPAMPQTVEAFVDRMRTMAETKLRSFNEVLLGAEIKIFGNAAVAVAACEITENGTDASRSVELFLLVKTEGFWRIVSQAWDAESPSNLIPSGLLEDRQKRR
jgi:hypothetical protein